MLYNVFKIVALRGPLFTSSEWDIKFSASLLSIEFEIPYSIFHEASLSSLKRGNNLISNELFESLLGRNTRQVIRPF